MRIAFIVFCLLMTGATPATPINGRPLDVLPSMPAAPRAMDC